MRYALHCRDFDNARKVETTINHPLWGETFVMGYQTPLVEIGAADLPEAKFNVGKLVLTDGVMDRHGDAEGAFDIEPLRPYIERFFAADWNADDGDGERDEDASGHINDLLIDGETGAFIWDAFSHDGERYNIVCYLALETTVMLADEY